MAVLVVRTPPSSPKVDRGEMKALALRRTFEYPERKSRQV
jgi:hypothetical protein